MISIEKAMLIGKSMADSERNRNNQGKTVNSKGWITKEQARRQGAQNALFIFGASYCLAVYLSIIPRALSYFSHRKTFFGKVLAFIFCVIPAFIAVGIPIWIFIWANTMESTPVPQLNMAMIKPAETTIVRKAESNKGSITKSKTEDMTAKPDKSSSSMNNVEGAKVPAKNNALEEMTSKLEKLKDLRDRMISNAKGDYRKIPDDIYKLSDQINKLEKSIWNLKRKAKK